MSKKEDNSFPIWGMIGGSFGLLVVILSILPHDKAIPDILGLLIMVVGGIIGGYIEVHFRKK